jgi:hypothetical protein
LATSGDRFASIATASDFPRTIYEKLGYTVFGELKDCPPGHAHYFLSKAL